ncbi:MAG: DUF3619 family protein [Rhodoferax sp.]|nr:DUF3619 family protein [Rhodoferax sp.]MBP9929149.1 DUF3619 family protein [Rhodoferax sp.]HQX60198.1 DUF3619 family protein [Burkholderiaceae bacterium]HQZ06283.1 DUF3619 family protein [Burkholderiaceae bacterium]
MTTASLYEAETPQDRFARRLTARLSEGCDDLPRDISERLRFARTQALAKRKPATDKTVALGIGSGAATLGRVQEQVSWWNKLGAVIPLLALVLGLIIINSMQDDRFAHEMAQLDAELLTDDLPLAAYADPGFVQFLKAASANAR